MLLQVSCLWGGGEAKDMAFSSLVRSFLRGSEQDLPGPLGRGGSIPCCWISREVAFFPTWSMGTPGDGGSVGH